MADAENAAACASKKRTAGRQISKDKPELDDDTSESEMGTFQRASEEVLATRRIVKVRRQPASTASSNPFAAIRLVKPTESTTKGDSQVHPQVPIGEAALQETTRCDDERGDENVIKNSVLLNEANGAEEGRKFSEDRATDDDIEGAEPDKINTEEADETAAVGKSKEAYEEAEEEVVGNENGKTGESKATETSSTFSSFQQLSSSQNAFTSLSGTGFATSSFSFSFAGSNNGTSFSPLFPKAGGMNLQAVPVETGEENEKLVFAADATLYEYTDGSWKERGRGEVKVNTSLSGEKARLVMRTRGNYRLILNANLYPDMILTDMDKKGITFSCINSAAEGTAGLTTCALKFRDSGFVEDFRSVVAEHKGKKEVTLNAPENYPKGSDQ